MPHQQAYDYIIVGAGSAGCVLANRLSKNPDCSVLLLEAGARDTSPFIHWPGGFAKLFRSPKLNWCYTTEPEPELHNRRIFWPRGKVLGGSSSINAMVYIRGQAEDYDHWEQLGNQGWGFRDVLPHFIGTENYEPRTDTLHGSEGPLNVTDRVWRSPLTQKFLEAGQSIGLPLNPDFNGNTQFGVGNYDATMKDFKRCSAAQGFLKPISSRPNLTVLPNALAIEVELESNRARRVVTIHNGQKVSFHANSEIILSGGAINSPQLLMLSGIGPADDLQRVGVKAAHDLPGVGQNLQDHLQVYNVARFKDGVGGSYDNVSEFRELAKYLLFSAGPLASNIMEAGGFDKSRNDIARPDIQYHFTPHQRTGNEQVVSGNGITITSCALRPESRGHLRLKSDHATDSPAIHANYLSQTADQDVMVRGVERSREFFHAQPLKELIELEVAPGEVLATKTQLLEFIRGAAGSLFHPVGTCKMGAAADQMAVVDQDLRVHGIDALRVVDASIMPTLVSGNTNAPTIMIAEKAAQEMTNESHDRLKYVETNEHRQTVSVRALDNQPTTIHRTQ